MKYNCIFCPFCKVTEFDNDEYYTCENGIKDILDCDKYDLPTIKFIGEEDHDTIIVRKQEYERLKHIEESAIEIIAKNQSEKMNEVIRKTLDMTRAEELAFKFFPRNIDEPDSFAEAVGRRAIIDGYEQAKEETISIACKWLDTHLPIIVDYYNENIHEQADRDDFIRAFREYIEDKKI